MSYKSKHLMSGRPTPSGGGAADVGKVTPVPAQAIDETRLWWELPEPAPPRLYWRERFPVERARLDTSQAALKTLFKQYPYPQARGGRMYPWRLALFPGTGLPAFLRHWLPAPLDRNEAEAAGQASRLLTDTLAPALFGIAGRFEREFEPGPVISLQDKGGYQKVREWRHFTWLQVHQGRTVLGGSVRVHGVLGDERLSVTSSYFPIPAELEFGPEIPEYLSEWRALLAAIRACPVEARPSLLAAMLERFVAHHRSPEWPRLAALVLSMGNKGVGRRLLLVGMKLLQRLTPLAALLAPLMWLLWRAIGPKREAASVEVVPTQGRPRAILPFDGAYHLVCRVQIQFAGDEPWYVEVDVERGEVLGNPWQAAAHPPEFFSTSAEAASNTPSGDVSVVDVAELQNYLRIQNVQLNNLASESIEARTVAANAQRLYRHLTGGCGVQPAQLQREQGLEVLLDQNDTEFVYDQGLLPKQVKFERDPGAGISSGDQIIYAPARDPELIMHELTHGFLWLFNEQPWDLPPTLGPFGRALQEGYAIYLSHSLASGNNAVAARQPWAQAAYSPNKRDGSLNWGPARWAFNRSSNAPGEDVLTAPNVYPAVAYSVQDIRVYDVGMVWARAVWDVREMIGWERTDRLAVQAYAYLHGYIANFELAAEGLLDADIRNDNTLDLANGTLPIWAGRGIAAGQGVHAFARAGNTLIAACDAGILSYAPAPSPHWELRPAFRQASDAAGNTFTLSGVVAAAADTGGTFYAVAQLPPTTVAGTGTQWNPGIFMYDAALQVWQEMAGWPDEATPLCMLTQDVASQRRIFVGTSRGVYYATGSGGWQSVGDLQATNNAFTAIGLSLDGSASTVLRACTPTDISQISTARLADDWSGPTGSIFGGKSTARPTAIVTCWGQTYVSTLEDGLWQVGLGLSTTHFYPTTGATTDAILALAAGANHLYVATPKEVLALDSAGAVVGRLGLPTSGVVVRSLFETANNELLAGTLAHGIWRRTGGAWQQEYSPPLPEIVALAGNALALVSVMPQANGASQITITTHNRIQLERIFQVGFPLNPINFTGPGLGNTYSMPTAQGSAILLLKNTGGVPLTLRVQVSAGRIQIN